MSEIDDRAGKSSGVMLVEGEGGSLQGQQCTGHAPNFAEFLDHHPGEFPALAYSDETWDYARLRSRIATLAQTLDDAGILVGSRAAIVLRRSPDTIAALIACWKRGVVFAMIDPDWPPARVHAALEVLQPNLIMSAGSKAAELKASWEATPTLDLDSLNECSATGLKTIAVDVDPAKPAYICFTSGTTGRPKAAALTRNGLNNYLEWAAQTFAPDGRADSAFYSNPAVDFSLTAMLLPMVTGSTLTILSGEGLHELGNEIDIGRRFDFLKLTPTGLRVLLSVCGEARMRDCSNVFVLGGELLGEGLRAILSSWSSKLAIDEYGPTETVVGCIAAKIGSETPAGVVGRPIPRTAVQICSADGQNLPRGHLGEIVISGDCVGLGYIEAGRYGGHFGRPNETQGEYATYATGDLGRITRDGQVELRGRIDSQIKHRGYRLEPDEIASVIERHRDVEWSHCTQFECDGKAVLVAFAGIPGVSGALKETVRSHTRMLRAHLAEQLPAYAIPDQLLAVEKAPLAASGKLDVKQLEEVWRERTEKGQQEDNDPLGHDAPEQRTVSLANQDLKDVWQRVLGADCDPADGDFFEQGGDSMRALMMISELRRRGWRLELADFMRMPEFSQLMCAMRRIAADDVGSPPSEKHLGRGVTANQASMLRVLGEIPKDWITMWNGRIATGAGVRAVRRAFAELVRAHPELGQAIGGESTGDIFRFATAKDATDLQQELVAAREWIDPQAGRNTAVTICAGEDNDFEVHWIIHHAVIDLVSWTSLLAELRTRLEGARLPVEQGRDALLEEETGSWQWDSPRQDFGLAHRWSLSQGISLGALTELYPVHLATVLQVALGRALCRESGRPSTLVCQETHGRSSSDAQARLGWLTGYQFASIAHPDDEEFKAAMARCAPVEGITCRTVANSQPDAAINFVGTSARSELAGTLDFHPHQDGTVPLRIFPLQLNVALNDGVLESDWVFGTAVLQAARIERIFQFFRDELEALAKQNLPAAAMRGAMTPHAVAYGLNSRIHGAPCHVEQVSIAVSGVGTPDRVVQLFEQLEERHEALRTTVDVEGETPREVCVTSSEPCCEIEFQRPDESLDAAIRRIRAAHSAWSLEPGERPYRATYLSASGDEGTLVWSHHHGAFDGLSQSVLLQEMVALHDGRPLHTAMSPKRYRSWQQGLVAAWLPHGLAALSPPGDGARYNPQSQETTFGTLHRRIPKRIADQLSDQAKSLQLSQNAIVSWCWAEAAYRAGLVAGDEAIGIMVSGRSPDFEASDKLVASLSLPVGVKIPRVDSASVVECVRQLARTSAEIAQSVNPFAPSTRLGRTIVSTVTYPESFGSRQGGLVLKPDYASATGGFAPGRVTATFTVGALASMRIAYDQLVLDHVAARDLMACFLGVLRSFLADPQQKLPDRVSKPAPARKERAAPIDVENAERIQCITQEFARLLNSDVIDADADFFISGGHSLLALRLTANLRQHFAVPIGLVDLLETRTPRQLAARLALRERQDDAGSKTASPSLADSNPLTLTPLQQAYLIGRNEDFELGGVDAYLYAEFDFDEFDIGKAERCFTELVERHLMLRAAFTEHANLKIRDDVEFKIERIDLSGMTEELASEELLQLRAERSHGDGDLSQPPLISIAAVAMPGALPFRVLVGASLLIGDARSWMILAAEFTALYEGRRLPRHTDIPTQPRQFAAHDELAAKTFWLERVEELPEPPILPLARRTDEVLTAGRAEKLPPRFERRSCTLDRQQTEVLRSRAQECSVTVSVLLAALYSEILARFGEERAHLLNFTLFDRPDGQTNSVGDFTAPLLVANCMASDSFASRVSALQTTLWEAIDHRAFDGVHVQRELAKRTGKAAGAQAPVVFTSTLDFGFLSEDKLMPDGCEFIWGLGQTPQVSLDYQVYERGGDIHITWDSVEGHFALGLIDEMFNQHRDALGVLCDPAAADWKQSPLSALRLLESADPAFASRLLQSEFLQRAAETPEAPAIICADRKLSYAQLASESASLAGALIDAGVSRGERVAIELPKGWRSVVAAIAILRAGAVFVPFDTEWPAERRALMAEQVKPVLLIRSEMCSANVPPGVRIFDFDAAMEHSEHADVDTMPVDPDDPAYVIFTSGSSGTPKAAILSHAAAANTIDDINHRFGIGAGDVVFGISALCFDLSIFDLFGALSAGAAVSLPEQDEIREPRAWLARLQEDRVTVWNSVPVLMSLLLDACEGRYGATFPEGLRLALLSGDWIAPNLGQRIHSRIPGCRVVSLGGATEAAIWSIIHEIQAEDASLPSIPYGMGLAGQWVAVCDDTMAPCPVHVSGEIVIGGRGVALGYANNDVASARQFPTHPQTGERVYLTGDFGRLMPNGEIELLGRRDRQVKIAGNRIEIGEIEAAVRRVDDVADFCVVASGARETKQLVVYYSGTVEQDKLQAELAKILPPAVVPQSFRRLSEMPLTSNGKIDRQRLEQLACEQPVEAEGANVQGDTHMTMRISRFAAGFLDGAVPTESENLFQCGMHSISAMRLLNVLEREFGHRIRFGDFVSEPTVRALTHRLLKPLETQKLAEGEGRQNRVDLARDPWLDPVPAKSGQPDDKAMEERHSLPAGIPLYCEDIDRRRSYRTYSDQRIPLEMFARFLSCLRQVERNGAPAYFYPSAGGKYAIDIYVAVKRARIEGLASGLYRYDAERDDLVSILPFAEIDAATNLGGTNLELARASAFSVYMVTKPALTVPIYGEAAQHLAYLNAGYMGDLLCRSALAAGLGLCPVDGVDFDSIRHLFEDGLAYELVHALYGGVPDDMPPRGHVPEPSDRKRFSL